MLVPGAGFRTATSHQLGCIELTTQAVHVSPSPHAGSFWRMPRFMMWADRCRQGQDRAADHKSLCQRDCSMSKRCLQHDYIHVLMHCMHGNMNRACIHRCAYLCIYIYVYMYIYVFGYPLIVSICLF